MPRFRPCPTRFFVYVTLPAFTWGSIALVAIRACT